MAYDNWEPRRKRSVWKGLVAGLAGGLVASWTMNEFQKGWSAAAERLSPDGSNGKSRNSGGSSEDPTGETAHAISKKLLGKPLTQEQKKKAGPVVHYAFGTLLGGLYGATSEVVPKVKMAAGLPYGVAVFVGADEIALPALKLSQGPTAYPVSRHLYALSSHLVWATTTDVVRRLVRGVL